MSILWSADAVALATGGTTTGHWQAQSVSIDTRTLAPGALFVALKGERSDGHAHLDAAFARGAAGALVSETPAGFSADDPRLVHVADTEKALQAIGIYARNRSRAKFIGITGSVGKTGAKEMLRTALVAVGRVYATTGNLNNHLGVPLTLANMPLDTEYAIIEMGMNHAGEIALLSGWVRPDAALITTVDKVHIEFFGHVEGIADAKAEIFSGMQGGVAILNRDNPHYARLRASAEARGLDRILSFGTHEQALCRLNRYRIEEDHSEIEATLSGTAVRYALGTIGKHWALMSVAVLGVVDALGANVAQSAEALAQFSEPKGRGKIQTLAVAGGHLRLVDDSYNASPVSMEGAFAKLAEIKAASAAPAPRTVIVLGDMLELGESSEELHVGLVPSIVNNQIDLVFAAGSFMQHLYDALPVALKGAYAPTAAALAPKVLTSLKPRDIVLVKGSHGSRMRDVVEAIESNARAVEQGGH